MKRVPVLILLLSCGCSPRVSSEVSSVQPAEPAAEVVDVPAEVTKPEHPYAELPEPPEERPYAELPQPGEQPEGDAYGDPQGWSNAAQTGDPWAADVMGTLNRVKWPAFVLEASEGHSYEFKLKVCKDGRIAEVIEDEVVSDPERDAAIKATLEHVALKSMPEHMTAKMKSDCAVLNYWFRWQRGRVR